MQEKDGEEHLDRLSKIWRSITKSQEINNYPTYRGDDESLAWPTSSYYYKKDMRNSKFSVAVTYFLTLRAKDLSAPLYIEKREANWIGHFSLRICIF
jgi:hypothetical protein